MVVKCNIGKLVAYILVQDISLEHYGCPIFERLPFDLSYQGSIDPVGSITDSQFSIFCVWLAFLCTQLTYLMLRFGLREKEFSQILSKP
ncbi:MAG: hypothetical protein Q4A64_04465 [Porphyromonadaceae bacterium]|nr:hypothetical protein [Porphyromonadaceae bacterium]